MQKCNYQRFDSQADFIRVYSLTLWDDSFIVSKNTQVAVIMAKSGLISLVNSQILKWQRTAYNQQMDSI